MPVEKSPTLKKLNTTHTKDKARYWRHSSSRNLGAGNIATPKLMDQLMNIMLDGWAPEMKWQYVN